jgi:GntR family transcriptional repressor for pyruvate dehydrogenase complex
METRLTDRERVMLETIRESPLPLGSWNMVDLLARKGIDVSASTVGRMLNHLEKRGYLSKNNVNQGRTITAKGTALLERIQQQRSLQPLSERLGEAINTNVLDRYLKVLEARKVIEGATVRLAAENISEAELRKLERIVTRREQSHHRNESVMPYDIAFHSLIAAASRNEVLSLLYQTIAAQGQQSRRFEYIRKQVGAPYLNSNRNILNALKERDAALAEKLIKRHLDTLISDVKKYWHTFLD